MQVSINNPIQATWICISIIVVALLVSLRRSDTNHLSYSVTQELKGFAILSVIFAHIGYFLVTDTHFLFPLSIVSGVGVNLFLFLSGYGLTMSMLKKQENPIQFYKRKLLGLFVPLWIVLIMFLKLDYLIQSTLYSWSFITKAFLGIFTSSNIFTDFNSPLWYFTLILFYYLLFPLVFSKKYPWFSALILWSISYFIIKANPTLFVGVLGLYKVHILAFPLGITSAWLFSNSNSITNLFFTRIKNLYIQFKIILYPLLMITLLSIFGYTAIHSGVGESAWTEQSISLVSMFVLILLFIFKKYKSELLSLFGLYSYEIYLLHWPLVYRYDFLYRYTPAWIATIGYLCIFIGLGFLLKKLSGKLSNFVKY
jgi:peptidoglycan/LPS O-acetylase OafA/YrhL